MNRHVVRVSERNRQIRFTNWAALLLTVFFMGLGFGRASHAQEAFSSTVGLGNAGYPISSVPVQNSSGNVAAAAATATLPAGSVAQYTYISGFEFTSAGSTAAAVVTCTVTNIKGGTLSYTMTTIAGATLANAPLIVEFSPALPTLATASTIVVSCPSLGAGNTNATMVAHGFQQ